MEGKGAIEGKGERDGEGSEGRKGDGGEIKVAPRPKQNTQHALRRSGVSLRPMPIAPLKPSPLQPTPPYGGVG
ncbi:unnamed protein product [Boreogadus saida]